MAPPPRFSFLNFVLQVYLSQKSRSCIEDGGHASLFSEASVLTRHLLGGGFGGESEVGEGDIPGLHPSGLKEALGAFSTVLRQIETDLEPRQRR